MPDISSVTALKSILFTPISNALVKTLSNGDRFQFVVADLLKPSGGRFEEEGVVPDIVVDRKQEYYVDNIDPELQAAITFFKKKYPIDDSEEQSQEIEIQETEQLK